MRKIWNRFKGRFKKGKGKVVRSQIRKPITLERKQSRKYKALLKQYEVMMGEPTLSRDRALAWNGGVRERARESEDYGWMGWFH